METRKEIERVIEEAGWELDDGFGGYLVIGEDHHLSILAYQGAWETDEPAFELCDGEKELTCWVREVPSPQRATELLEEHGGPPEEEMDALQEGANEDVEGERHQQGV